MAERLHARFWLCLAAPDQRTWRDEPGPITAHRAVALTLDDGELAGRVLGCWCDPDRCHGGILTINPQLSPEQALAHQY